MHHQVDSNQPTVYPAEMSTFVQNTKKHLNKQLYNGLCNHYTLSIGYEVGVLANCLIIDQYNPGIKRSRLTHTLRLLNLSFWFRCGKGRPLITLKLAARQNIIC